MIAWKSACSVCCAKKFSGKCRLCWSLSMSVLNVGARVKIGGVISVCRVAAVASY